MLTMLNVVMPQPQTKIQKLLYRYKCNKTNVYYRKHSNITIRVIEYIKYNKDINWRKLDAIIGAARNRLLCNSDLLLPQELSYRRFDDTQYKIRLCKNLAVKLLMDCKRKVSVQIVDKDAEHTDFIKYLLKYTNEVTVVTNKEDIYRLVADELLENSGAVLSVLKSESNHKHCDILVLLSNFGEYQKNLKDTIVLTAYSKYKDISRICVYDYFLDKNAPFKSLCPESLEQTYFAAALYSMCNVYQLGSLIPSVCVGNNTTYTVEMLENLLNNIGRKLDIPH